MNRETREMFRDIRRVKPKSFMAGCLLFGLMISGMVLQLMIGREK